jgi:hypothetical protein
MWRHLRGLTTHLVVAPLLGALALSCVAARADDVHKSDVPDPGFLEFLGSVDRLAEVNPDYLAQLDPPGAGASGAGRPSSQSPGTSPSSAPPRQPPPASASGGPPQ